MTGQKAQRWSESERMLLDAILEQLIPASADGRIPSAASLGVAGFLAEKVATEPALEALFQRGLDRAADLIRDKRDDFAALAAADQRVMVEQLETHEPAFFEALLRHTYMGYYSDARIRPLFGLSANPTQPEGYAVPRDDRQELAALIEPVKRRGHCFRDA